MTAAVATATATARPVSSIAPHPELTPPQPKCSRCGGHDLKSVTLLKQMGESDLNLKTQGAASGSGIGVVSGRLAAFVGSASIRTQTVGTQQNKLAGRLMPPVRQTVSRADWNKANAHLQKFMLLLLVLASAVGHFTTIGFGVTVGLAGAVIIAVRDGGQGLKTVIALRARYFAEYDARLRDWNRSAMCMACGEIQLVGRSGV